MVFRHLMRFVDDERSATFRTVALPFYFRLPKHLRFWLRQARGATPVYAETENKLGVIFVHIPKNGGSAISQCLSGDPKAKHYHYPADFYRWENPDLFASLTSFAVVRDPLQRLHSAYLYLKALPDDVTDTTRLWVKKNIAPIETFEQMIVNWLTRSRMFYWPHFMPQSYFVMDSRGNLIVDHLLRFNHLSDDFALFAERHIPGQVARLKRVNVSRLEQYEQLSEEAINKVHKLYAKDYELLEKAGLHA